MHFDAFNKLLHNERLDNIVIDNILSVSRVSQSVTTTFWTSICSLDVATCDHKNQIWITHQIHNTDSRFEKSKSGSEYKILKYVS